MSATADNTNSGGWLQSDFMKSLGGLVIDAARAKVTDVERESDDSNVPDRADMEYSTPQAEGTGALGGAYNVVGGLTPMQWGGLAVAAVLTVVLIKRVV